MPTPLSKVFRTWLPLALIIIGLVAFIAIGLQQNYRQNANDPQIQMAEDAAAAIDSGATPQSQVPTHIVDMATSLAPFVIVMNDDGKVLATSGQLNKATPLPPTGALTDGHRFTWEPSSGVRLATVVAHYTSQGGGYVITARNLSEVETRENSLLDMASFVLVGLLAATLLVIFILK